MTIRIYLTATGGDEVVACSRCTHELVPMNVDIQDAYIGCPNGSCPRTSAALVTCDTEVGDVCIESEGPVLIRPRRVGDDGEYLYVIRMGRLMAPITHEEVTNG